MSFAYSFRTQETNIPSQSFFIKHDKIRNKFTLKTFVDFIRSYMVYSEETNNIIVDAFYDDPTAGGHKILYVCFRSRKQGLILLDARLYLDLYKDFLVTEIEIYKNDKSNGYLRNSFWRVLETGLFSFFAGYVHGLSENEIGSNKGKLTFLIPFLGQY